MIAVASSSTRRSYANSYFWNSKRHRRLWEVGGASIWGQHLNFILHHQQEGGTIFKLHIFFTLSQKNKYPFDYLKRQNLNWMLLDICWSKYLFNFSFLGNGMTFSHMDIGELINLRLPPSPSEALIEGALLVQCAWGLPLITHCVLLWRTSVGSALQSRLVS